MMSNTVQHPWKLELGTCITILMLLSQRMGFNNSGLGEEEKSGILVAGSVTSMLLKDFKSKR